MKNDELVKAITKANLALRFDLLRALARVKALEAMVEHTMVSKEKRGAWHKQLNVETQKRLQEMLEFYEKQNPGLSAQLDMREPSELEGL